MSDRSRKLTKVGIGPSIADSGKVPKFRSMRLECPAPSMDKDKPSKSKAKAKDDEPLPYRATVPAPPMTTPPVGRKTAAYDSFVDAKETASAVITEPPKEEPRRAPRTSVRRTEPPPPPTESAPPRSARVRRSEPPEPIERVDRTTRSGREAIAVDEVGPTRPAISLPPGARPKVAPRKKGASPPPLNGRDAHVLVYVNGQRTVKDIVEASKLRPSDTATSLQKLLRIGVIVF